MVDIACGQTSLNVPNHVTSEDILELGSVTILFLNTVGKIVRALVQRQTYNYVTHSPAPSMGDTTSGVDLNHVHEPAEEESS